MKKLLIILQIAFLPFLVSCKKETPVLPSGPSQTITVDSASRAIATCNKWVIASYIKDGSDHTADFNMTGLYFCPDDFTVANDIMSQNGKWFFSKTADYLQLNLMFNSDIVVNPVWQELQDGWMVNNFEPNLMLLQSADRTRRITLKKLER